MSLLGGKTAIVTGAGRGIGRATALELARLGAAVVVNDLGTSSSGQGCDASIAEEVVQEIRSLGGRAIANSDSVSDFDAAGRIIAAAVETYGGVDILVNNAGLTLNEPIWKADPASFDRVVKSHLYGTFHCTRHAVPHMMDKEWGRIVNLVSRGGLTGIAGTAAYGAGKGGIFGLTNVCARDLVAHGITVNGVNPSSTVTRMVTQAVDTLRAQGNEGARQAEGLLAVAQLPEQVAVVIAALCSDEAAAITGEYFLVKKNEIGMFQPLTVTQTVSREDDDPWSPDELVTALLALERHSLAGPY